MVASQNGWRANDPSVIASRIVPGTTRSVRVRIDAPGTLLLEIAAAFNRWVEPIGSGQLDDWGYAERPIRGGVALSNHASGTAIDLNALKHPLGTDPLATYRRQDVEVIHQIVAVTGNVVRWGGDYGDTDHGGVKGSRPDSMHFEVNDGQSSADCERALKALRSWPGPAFVAVTLSYGMHHPDVVRLQTILTTRYPAYAHWAPITDFFGDQTLAAVKEFQRRSGLPADGIVGPDTRRALGM